MTAQHVIVRNQFTSNVIGNITASGQTVSSYVKDFSTIIVSMVASSLSGHSTIYEVSNNALPVPGTQMWDGVSGTWYSVQTQRSGTGTIETGDTSLSATPTYGRIVNVTGWTWLRIRATAHTAGTATYTIAHNQNTPALYPNTTVTVSSGTSLIGFVNAAPSASSTQALSLNAKLATAAGTTNATVVKATAGRIYQIYGYNAAAAVRYLKLYAKATTPTVGTDTPVLIIPLAPSKEFNVSLAGDIGFYLTNGIGYALTVNPGDADATAVTAGDIVGMNIIYI